MPQNNQDTVNSPEFKEFVKTNNLEVFNHESYQLALFNLAGLMVNRWKENIELQAKLDEYINW